MNSQYSSTARFFSRPRKHSDFKQALLELAKFVCPRAESAGLRMGEIQAIYSDNEPKTTIGFQITATETQGYGDKKGVTGDMYSIQSWFCPALDQARQDIVNRKKRRRRGNRKLMIFQIIWSMRKSTASRTSPGHWSQTIRLYRRRDRQNTAPPIRLGPSIL